jgi:hypothetical protein
MEFLLDRFVRSLMLPLLGLLLGSWLCGTAAAQDRSPQTNTVKNSDSPSVPLEDKEGAILPFRYEPPVRPFITVQARLNNSEPLTFVVDTGSEVVLLLAPWVEKQLGLKSSGKPFPLHPGNYIGHVIEGAKLAFVTVAGGKAMIIPVNGTVVAEVPVLRNYFGTKIAGVIGGEFFTKLISRFDFDKSTLTFFTTDHSPVKPAVNEITLPVFIPVDGYRPYVKLGLSPRVSATLIVDTGADSLHLPAELAKKLPLAATGGPSAEIGIGGEHRATDLLAQQITLGMTLVPLVPVTSVEGQKEGYLGIDFLSRFRITIDPASKQLILELRHNMPLVFQGDAGVHLANREGQGYVDSLTRPVPARSGIEVGDQIVAVDGQSVMNMPFHQIVKLVDGYAQTWMDLTVQHTDGKQETVRLLRRSLYPSVVPNTLGTILMEQKDKSWTVLYVQPGSEAEQAGIKTGDTMLSLNGREAQTLKLEEVEELLADTGSNPSPLKEMILKSKDTGREIILPKK